MATGRQQTNLEALLAIRVIGPVAVPAPEIVPVVAPVLAIGPVVATAPETGPVAALALGIAPEEALALGIGPVAATTGPAPNRQAPAVTRAEIASVVGTCHQVPVMALAAARSVVAVVVDLAVAQLDPPAAEVDIAWAAAAFPVADPAVAEGVAVAVAAVAAAGGAEGKTITNEGKTNENKIRYYDFVENRPDDICDRSFRLSSARFVGSA